MDRIILISYRIDIYAVLATLPVGSEQGIISILRLYIKKIISRRRVRKSHILRSGPFLALLVPDRLVKVITADAVKSVGSKEHRPAVRGKHRVDLICRLV